MASELSSPLKGDPMNQRYHFAKRILSFTLLLKMMVDAIVGYYLLSTYGDNCDINLIIMIAYSASFVVSLLMFYIDFKSEDVFKMGGRSYQLKSKGLMTLTLCHHSSNTSRSVLLAAASRITKLDLMCDQGVCKYNCGLPTFGFGLGNVGGLLALCVFGLYFFGDQRRCLCQDNHQEGMKAVRLVVFISWVYPIISIVGVAIFMPDSYVALILMVLNIIVLAYKLIKIDSSKENGWSNLII